VCRGTHQGGAVFDQPSGSPQEGKRFVYCTGQSGQFDVSCRQLGSVQHGRKGNILVLGPRAVGIVASTTQGSRCWRRHLRVTLRRRNWGEEDRPLHSGYESSSAARVAQRRRGPGRTRPPHPRRGPALPTTALLGGPPQSLATTASAEPEQAAESQHRPAAAAPPGCEPEEPLGAREAATPTDRSPLAVGGSAGDHASRYRVQRHIPSLGSQATPTMISPPWRNPCAADIFSLCSC
jgi:hypothetical protein